MWSIMLEIKFFFALVRGFCKVGVPQGQLKLSCLGVSGVEKWLFLLYCSHFVL